MIKEVFGNIKPPETPDLNFIGSIVKENMSDSRTCSHVTNVATENNCEDDGPAQLAHLLQLLYHRILAWVILQPQLN